MELSRVFENLGIDSITIKKNKWDKEIRLYFVTSNFGEVWIASYDFKYFKKEYKRFTGNNYPLKWRDIELDK